MEQVTLDDKRRLRLGWRQELAYLNEKIAREGAEAVSELELEAGNLPNHPERVPVARRPAVIQEVAQLRAELAAAQKELGRYKARFDLDRGWGTTPEYDYAAKQARIAELTELLQAAQQERNGMERERDEQQERALRLDKWAWELHAKLNTAQRQEAGLRTALTAARQWMEPVIEGFGLDPHTHVVLELIRNALSGLLRSRRVSEEEKR